MKRKTLKNIVEYDGIGLHKGEIIKMKLIPAKSGGIIFRMVNIPEGKNEILLDYRNTFDLTRGTNLKNEHGAMVFTIEHFLSALYVSGITDLVIELNEFSWQICIAMIPGMAAREVVVSALGTVYAMTAESEDALEAALIPVVSENWGLPTAFAFLAWYVYAPMCLATLAIIRRETNSLKHTLTIAGGLFLAAYVFAFIVYRITSWVLA